MDEFVIGLIALIIMIFIIIIISSFTKPLNISNCNYNTMNDDTIESDSKNSIDVRDSTSELIKELIKAIELCDSNLYIKYTSDSDLEINESLKNLIVYDCKNMYSTLTVEQKENLYTFMAIGRKYGRDTILEYYKQIAKVTKLREYFDIQDKYNIRNEIRYYENLFKDIMPSPFLNDEEEVEYREMLNDIAEKLKLVSKLASLETELKELNREYTKVSETLGNDKHRQDSQRLNSAYFKPYKNNSIELVGVSTENFNDDIFFRDTKDNRILYTSLHRLNCGDTDLFLVDSYMSDINVLQCTYQNERLNNTYICFKYDSLEDKLSWFGEKEYEVCDIHEYGVLTSEYKDISGECCEISKKLFPYNKK